MNLAEAFTDAQIPGVSPGVYSDADFQAISRLLHEQAGIVLPKGKAMLVYSRIAPLVRQSNCGTFADYLRLIGSNPVETKRVIDALTTNHTFFYREAHHFEHFAAQVRADLLARLESNDPVRIWSAGCSSGEETWSLIVTLLGEDQAEGKRMIRRNLRVLASDLAAHVLRRAEAGVYGAAEVRDVPRPLRQLWLSERNEEVSIGPEARAIVRFRELNLLGDWPMRQQFDVIFCRNVMIYFDLPTKERLVLRFAEQLQPGGYLYIGHSERVTGAAAALLEPVGPTIYRKRTA